MALRKYWPELLDSLRTSVFPKYRPESWNNNDPEERRAIFESWARLQSDSARKDLLTALQNWATQFRITEEWILQTALDTLQGYSPHPDTPMSAARPERSE